jgi:exodeoxyribonuclease VII large subunit
MRARHVSELTHALLRTGRAIVSGRARRLQQVQSQLATFDAGRRLAGIRTRLVAVDGRLRGAAARRYDRARADVQHAVGRLESLSPLAVLGRGYAVCWNEDRSRVLRNAATVETGDHVKVRLAKGELDCEVRAATDETPGTPKSQRT